MVFYNDKKIKNQIESDYKELENYKNSYSKRISLYNLYLDTMQVFENGIIEKNNLNKEKLEEKIKVFQIQINKINSNLELLSNLLNDINATGNINIEKKILNKYNQKYKEIKNKYIANSVSEEQITESYIYALMADLSKTLEKMKEEYIKDMNKIIEEKENSKYAEEKNDMQYAEDKENSAMQKENKIETKEEKANKTVQLKNNNTLLISEKLGKVILPYKAKEVLDIFNNENGRYSSLEEVIEEKFTRKFSDFKNQYISRYKETLKLTREREKFSLSDSIILATEIMYKKYLHPAIIAACRTLDELDVYIDCLDKNELEDFKIFKIKYELYPMVVKGSNATKRSKHSKGSHAKNDGLWNNIRKFLKTNKNKSKRNMYDF